jgi:lysophospholipase L1-like esterase
LETAKSAIPKYRPNVILINVGSNDIGANIDLDNAGARMKELINYLFTALPYATVVLSTLVSCFVISCSCFASLFFISVYYGGEKAIEAQC